MGKGKMVWKGREEGKTKGKGDRRLDFFPRERGRLSFLPWQLEACLIPITLSIKC